MGGRASTLYTRKCPPALLQGHVIQNIIKHWRLTDEEINHFYAQFEKLDADGSGTIEPLEFFGFLGEARTRLLNYILPLIVHTNEPLSFELWMQCIFGFCFMTEHELIQHVFEKYDSQKIGKITLLDLYKYLKHIHADNPMFAKDVVILLTNEIQDHGGAFDFDSFEVTCKKFAMLLYPILRIQHEMRRCLFGLRFFFTLDARTSDITDRQTIDDYPDMNFIQANKDWFKLWCCSFKCCCLAVLPTKEEIQKQQAASHALKQKKKMALQRLKQRPEDCDMIEDEASLVRQMHELNLGIPGFDEQGATGASGGMQSAEEQPLSYFRYQRMLAEAQAKGQDLTMEEAEEKLKLEQEKQMKKDKTAYKAYIHKKRKWGRSGPVILLPKQMQAYVDKHVLMTYDEDRDSAPEHFTDVEEDEFEDAQINDRFEYSGEQEGDDDIHAHHAGDRTTR